MLHEELAREIRALAPADRDLLLRRFFDDVPPRDLGALPRTGRVDVDATGHFSLPIAVRARALRLSIPPAFLALSVDGVEPGQSRTEVVLDAAVGSVRIDLTSLPAITGAYVWDDDGAPVQTTVRFTRLKDNGYSLDGTRWAHLTTGGRFSIGIDELLERPVSISDGGANMSIAVVPRRSARHRSSSWSMADGCFQGASALCTSLARRSRLTSA